MVISSREALRSIERAIGTTRRDEDRLTKMLQSATDDAARLRNEKAEALKSLARIRLDHLTADETAGRLDSAERRAIEALEAHTASVASAEQILADTRTALEQAEEAREAAGSEAAAAAATVDELIDRVFAEIDDNPDWVAQSGHLAQAEATAGAAAEKAALAEADREEKGRPYEADTLFMYLWQRGFGTSRYRAGPFVRFFDGKVAELIGYNAARPNYHMLNEIPLRLREHAERLAVDAAAEREKLELIERANLVAGGVEPLEQAADIADQALEDAEDRVEDKRQDLESASRDYAERSDDRKDANLQAALEVLAEEMGREDLSVLYREAQETPTPKDERIVQTLRDLERRIERRDAEAEEVRRAATELATKRVQLEQSRDHFRQSGFDDPRGQFANGDMIAAAIEGVIRGALSSGGLNKTLRDGFSRRAPRAGGSFGGGLRTTRSSRGFGGGFSGGGFSGGGRMGGGGFKTGGGF